MKKINKIALQICVVAGCLFSNANAAYIDFTDSTYVSSFSSIANGFRGYVDGIGYYNLTSSKGTVNFKEKYDGSLPNPGWCQKYNGPLLCDLDGAGIDNDEISGDSAIGRQIMNLVFDTEVYIHSMDFLDLYLNPDREKGGEQVSVSFDGSDYYTLGAKGSSGDGGYANLDLLSYGGGPIRAQNIELTAFQGLMLQDDRDNDYAFAGMKLSAVPLPATAWLFGTALIGLIGLNLRKGKV